MPSKNMQFTNKKMHSKRKKFTSTTTIDIAQKLY